ncbi:MAG: orotidine-5'-phosphate decarboxylase, partial [Lactococcus raffinolactis]
MGKFTENRPVIALDFSGMSEVKTFLTQFETDEQLYVKVGMELFYAAGPDVIKYIKSLGHDVFLDLKLHDIPNTVKSAMKVIRHLGVDLTNVHAAGGVEMMSEALDGLAGSTKLIAVTQLTSTCEQ